MSLITEDNATNLCEYVIKEYIESNKLAKDITKKTLQQMYNNSSCPKSEILIELINLLKFSKNTQTFLLSLEPEKRKIVLNFPDNLIKILIELSSSDIKYLLNNDVLLTDEIIKFAVEKDGLLLKYVPEDKMTNEIIKFAIKKDSYVLLYVPKNKLTDEIIKFAVETDGRALEYIPDDRKTEEIIKIAVQQNRLALEFVRLSKEKLIELGI